VGTASWTDRTLLAPGVFYPNEAKTPEARLRYYASRFPVVEVDSTYYALPARRTAALWAERTPEAFTFNVKAYAPFTGQPTETARLPKALRETLPTASKGKTRVYPKDLPPELIDTLWGEFLGALQPLVAAGKLGSILLQYPRWFVPNEENRERILDAAWRVREAGVLPTVELRNHRWFGEEKRATERTLGFLAEHDLPMVIVDGPQGFESSVPAVAAVTSPKLATVRLHGHNGATWEAKGVPTVERYRYLYDRTQLEGLVPRVRELARQAERTHVVFNNCYGNYGTTNALEMTALLTR
jgi:uncharacterized protein YecE (DUF72 family)